MPPKNEQKYWITNHQTNHFILPLYREREVIYEDLEPNDAGQYVKVFKKRSEPIGAGQVVLKGAHHRNLVNPEQRALVNKPTLDQFKANPIFMELVQSNVIRIAEAPADATEEAEE